MPTFLGLNVVLDPNMVEVELVTLSWGERLRSFRPWIKTRVITTPTAHAYVDGRNIVMHPATWRRVRHATSAL